MKRLSVQILVLLVITSSSFAQSLSNLTAAFVDIGIGARPLALGGAYSAVASDVNAVFWNPAGLAEMQGKAVDFSYVNQFGLIAYNSLAAGFSLGQNHAAGLGVLSSGDDQLRETTALVSYAFNGEDLLAGVLGHLEAGVTVKIHFANFGQGNFDASAYSIFAAQDVAAGEQARVSGSALGFGADFGALYAVSDRIRVAAVWRNALSKISWDNGDATYDEGVPQGVTFGAAFQPSANLHLSLDYDNSLTTARANRLRVGSERIVMQHFAIRGGIGQTLAADSQRDYAVGLGLVQRFQGFGRLGLDYAFQIHPLANSHRFSLGFAF